MAKRLIGEREIMIRPLEHLENGGKIEDVFGKSGQIAQNASTAGQNDGKKDAKSVKKNKAGKS